MRHVSWILGAVVVGFIAPGMPRAQESERAVAQWIIRLNGSVTLEPNAEPVRDLAKLPAADFHIVGIDLTGTLVEPEQLFRLSGLAHLRELYLPGPMWNEGAGSKRDSNEALEFLNPLKNLEKLHFSLHFLTNINLQDKGIAGSTD